jgi:hypothetical protein
MKMLWLGLEFSKILNFPKNFIPNLIFAVPLGKMSMDQHHSLAKSPFLK